MIVWKIQGDGVGPGGASADYFAQKSDANSRKREMGRKADVDGPTKTLVKDRYDLIELLHDAMKHAGDGSGSNVSGVEDDDAAADLL